jgi:NTP pyrophosphatase (non-canonical NTP hydrolase)
MQHFDNILGWARARNLITGSDPKSQFTKTVEEVGELAAGIARGDIEQIKDAIGDVMVTLTILAAQHRLDIDTCLAHAWEQIKDRRGVMRNGVFIKEADL